MTDQPPRNPFHVLGLPTGATTEEVVERGAEAAELAATDAERHAAVEAQRALITHPAVRRRHELLEVPGTEYRDRDGEAFDHAHRRPPVNFAALAEGRVPLRRDDFDVAAVLGLALDDLLTPPVPDVGTAVAAPPIPPGWDAPPIEVRHVLFG